MSQVKQGCLDLGDGQLYYETAGEGMPLILSHAGFLDSRMFDGVWDALAEHYRVIRYDMRGYGQSSPAAGPLCRRNDLAQLLNVLDVPRAHLVGCSNGGQISLDLALEQPHRVASLTLVGSTPSGFDMQGEPPRYLMEMFGAMQIGDIERSNELQVRVWLDGECREPGQVDQGLRRKALAMNRIPVAWNTLFIADAQPVNPLDPTAVTRLETVTCPTLIVAGSLDHPEVQRAADVMAARIPGARQAVIEGAGHVPSYEQPAKFAALLMSFLQGVN